MNNPASGVARLSLRASFIAVVLLFVSLLSAPAAIATDLRAIYPSDIKMRDGVHLAADVYLPKEPGRYPAILTRTPYDPKLKPAIDFPKRLAEAGYAVVINDCRGRFDSEGSFVPFKAEGHDGYDVVEWIAKQPWSDGQVGLMGSSYSGMASWQLAALQNPHVKAMFVIVAPGDLYRDIVFPGGAFALDTSLWWFSVVDRRTVQDWHFNDWDAAMKHLPVLTIDQQLGRNLEVMRDQMAHPIYGQYWKDFYSMDELYGRVKVPTFIVGGWSDSLVRGTLDTFVGTLKGFPDSKELATKVQALIGPWDHFGALTGLGTVYGDIDFGQGAAVDVSALACSWFDKWLRGKDLAGWQKQPLRYFLTGKNEWREDSIWPPLSAGDESFFFRSSGKANSSSGDGRLTREPPLDEPQDKFSYDPANPVPSLVSKHVLINSSVKDIRKIESRSDILVYTSDVLKGDLTVVGNPRLYLSVSTDAPDTDFTAWLTEVLPDGRSLSLQDGAVRCGRYLQPKAEHPLLKPGELYKVEIQLGSLAHVFKAGNRIRVNVSSSNFPAFDRNLNTGGDNWKEETGKVANQVVMHEKGAESQLILPVIH